MERVIVDMDEVIADPMGEMVQWYTEKYGLAVDYSKMINTGWIKGFPEQHQQECMQRLLSPGFFRNLPVMTGSQQVLEEINKRYELFIVSAAIEFPNSLKDKVEWLNDYFPFITWRQIVLCGDKKLISGDHMIDDHVRNLINFNGKKYLFTSAHNVDVMDYQRIDNWKEVADIFLG
ncbi:MAG: 5'(3')-deoxyribonucleotidase [Chitinophagaceae bacterium]|nr:5'(3')-deoxyribonucleotidase [Chitinophagaceae bacterium]